MAAAKPLAVLAPLVIIRDVAGVSHHFYAGEIVTATLPDDRRRALVAEGFLEEVTTAAQVAAVAPPEPTSDTPGEKDSVATWRAFAVATNVLTQDEADGMTKPKIVAAVKAAEGFAAEDDAATEELQAEDGVKVDGDPVVPVDPDAPTIS